MLKLKGLLLLAFMVIFSSGFAVDLTSDQIKKVGEKIWKSECKGTVEGLTFWNPNEGFPSLGIGHFIWYVKGKEERFEETFPALILFMKERGKVAFPLDISLGCPWESREEFYQEFHSPKMKALREYLVENTELQALFIVERLQKSLPEMLSKVEEQQRSKVAYSFNEMQKHEKTLFALVDYLHFKGSGCSQQERYKGKGWGLLHVLSAMNENAQDLLQEFVKSAKQVLAERVRNAPPERNEARWLQGWHNRLDSYLE